MRLSPTDVGYIVSSAFGLATVTVLLVYSFKSKGLPTIVGSHKRVYRLTSLYSRELKRAFSVVGWGLYIVNLQDIHTTLKGFSVVLSCQGSHSCFLSRFGCFVGVY